MTEEIAIATLDGKAYYTFTRILKSLGISFASLVPGEKTRFNTKLILTTRREKPEIDSNNILCVEELDHDLSIAKEKILNVSYLTEKEQLAIGVDPGKRIGLVAYYKNKRIESLVLSSIGETVNRISALVKNASGAKIIRIGEGSPLLSSQLASILKSELGEQIVVELVDERGTSTLTNSNPEIDGTRDEKSASLIATRQGRKYPP